MKKVLCAAFIVILAVLLIPKKQVLPVSGYTEYRAIIYTVTSNPEKKEKKVSVLGITMIDNLREIKEPVKEEEGMEEKKDIVAELSTMLNCDIETADSVMTVMKDVVKSDVVSVKKDKSKAYTILNIITADGNEYVALLGSGYTVHKIYKDSIDGECIYRIIL